MAEAVLVAIFALGPAGALVQFEMRPVQEFAYGGVKRGDVYRCRLLGFGTGDKHLAVEFPGPRGHDQPSNDEGGDDGRQADEEILFGEHCAPPELFVGCERSPEKGRSAVTCGPGPRIAGHRAQPAGENLLNRIFRQQRCFPTLIVRRGIEWKESRKSEAKSVGSGTSSVAKANSFRPSRFANAGRNMPK